VKISDRDIRKALYNQILAGLRRDDPTTKIVEEVGLCEGKARIDIVAINGALHGFEIKSESDDLRRLPGQIDIYNKVFDTITLITTENHFKKVLKLVPSWWGIIIAKKYPRNPILLKYEKHSKFNMNINPLSLVQLLWRDEALSILEERNLAKGLYSKPKRYIWEKLAAELSISELKTYVRNTLISRQNWRD